MTYFYPTPAFTPDQEPKPPRAASPALSIADSWCDNGFWPDSEGDKDLKRPITPPKEDTKPAHTDPANKQSLADVAEQAIDTIESPFQIVYAPQITQSLESPFIWCAPGHRCLLTANYGTWKYPGQYMCYPYSWYSPTHNGWLTSCYFVAAS